MCWSIFPVNNSVMFTTHRSLTLSDKPTPLPHLMVFLFSLAGSGKSQVSSYTYIFLCSYWHFFAHIDTSFAHIDTSFAHIDTPFAHIDTPFAHIYTPFAHIDAPIAHIDTPCYSRYYFITTTGSDVNWPRSVYIKDLLGISWPTHGSLTKPHTWTHTYSFNKLMSVVYTLVRSNNVLTHT